MSPFTIIAHILRGTTTDRDARWAIIWLVVWTIAVTLLIVTVFSLQDSRGLSQETLRAFLGLALG